MYKEYTELIDKVLGKYNRDDYDSPWKLALDNYLPEFLEFYFYHVYQLIDWKQPTKSLDNELQAVVKDSELGRNRADKLVEVTLKEGDKKILNIHIEVQSQKDINFEQRMFTYFYRIYDKYAAMPLNFASQLEELKTHNNRLPC